MPEFKVHIFKDEHLYNIALLKFLDGKFDLSEHRFIFLKKFSGKTDGLFPGKVFHYPGMKGWWKAALEARRSRKVFFHSLPMGPQLLVWTLFFTVFRKSVWIYWGADIYAYRNRYKSLKHFIYHICRRIIISRIPDIAGFLEDDFKILQKVYKTKATYHEVVYPIPTGFELIDNLDINKLHDNHNTFRVLLGNSCSRTNLHLEALDLLGKFRDKDLEIICPLSYGIKDEGYFREVIKKGREIYGERFVALTEFMQPEKYAELLAGIDIAIMNHNRQEALGNIISLLYLGKKVYLKPETSSYKYFLEKNIKVFNINDLHSIDYSRFLNPESNEVANNAQLLKNELSETNYKRYWEKVLHLT